MRAISRRTLGLGVCGVLALAACQAQTGPSNPWGFKASGAHAKPDDAASEAPSRDETPTPGASTSGSAALPPPPSGWTKDHQALESTVSEGLAALAQVSYMQARSQIDPATAAHLIGKARLPGIISNNGASIVSNNGGAYRLRAIAETIAAEAEAGEIVFADRHWTDGTTTRQFVKDLAHPDDAVRRVELDEAGHPYYQIRQSVVARHPDGTVKQYDKAVTTLYPDGRFRSYYQLLEDHDETGALTRVTIQRGSYRDADETLGLDIEAFAVDLKLGTGTFRYAYAESGLAEAGSLEGVTLDANGRIDLAYSDPLAFYDGRSEVTNKKGHVYGKRRRHKGKKTIREYDLKKDVQLVFDREEGGTLFGEVRVKGEPEGKTEQEVRRDGTVITRVTFPEAPERPLVVGYGIADAQADTMTPQAPRHVTTLAGAEAGFADGTGDVARFNTVRAVARSQVHPNRFYVADALNHRIRLVTLDGETARVETYAGDGTAGGDDGPALSARFDEPYGLAVGSDDTLYVSESHGNRIRVISPDKVVRTLAGDGVGTFAEGPAGFSMPAGVALDGQGRLWVADYGNNRVRLVTPEGVVTTAAGDGTEGLLDGPAATARFKRPSAIAVVGEDVLVLDSGNRRLRALRDGQVSTLAGSGDPDAPVKNAFADGPALSAGFNTLFGLAASDDGKTIYLGSKDLRALAGGAVRTVAGSTEEGTSDGVVKEASFTRIFGLAVTADGDLIVGHDHRLRLVPTH